MVVDHFSKVAHFILLGHPYMTTTVARDFFDMVVWLHGILSSVVNDRDLVFTSNFWKELFMLVGVKLYFSSTFHSQSDGQSEATNKTITMYLRCLAGDRPQQWLQWLPWAEFCYNMAFQGLESKLLSERRHSRFFTTVTRRWCTYTDQETHIH
jgi:hypothetical protein